MDNIFLAEEFRDYELLDSGDGKKLERYGDVILSRPDPQALWPKTLSEEEWRGVFAVFEQGNQRGKWLKPQGGSSDHLLKTNGLGKINMRGLVFNLKLLPSKHLGVFPEQSYHWKWLQDKIGTQYKLRMNPDDTNKKIKVLNLFGYTGGSTLACAKAGAQITHIDASKFAVDLAKQNLKDSGLGDSPVRFIVDDARKFVEREIKRGNKYDIIIMDPPVYGKGAKKEIWKIEENLPPFLLRVKKILSDKPVAVILNGYASGYSHITYARLLESMTENLGGKIISGELALKESKSKRYLPAGIFARWER